jgi:hypothetical protein
VLAVEPEAETYAQGGVQVWAANPIDALTGRTQSDFLDFLHKCQVPPTPELTVLVVQSQCVQRVEAQGWSIAERHGGLTVLTRPPDVDRSG